jgi:fermentation-respiration switch protein FrsA (DUF1100 family)
MAFFLNTIGFIIFAAVLIVLTQDLQLFPGYVTSLLTSPIRDPRTLPSGVESTFITTSDNKRIEVWRLAPEDDVEVQPYVGLVFHGNAGTLENFFLMQLWFQEQGITSYSFDYRGFGKSSGWPNEKGIYLDSDAFWQYVVEREQVSASRIIVCGFSVGGAPAARIAAAHNVKLLVLVSAFTNISDMIKGQWLLRPLEAFAWNKMPTIEFVQALKDTSLLLLHGEKDSIVPHHHSLRLEQAYRGSGGKLRLSTPEGDHNNVFFMERKRLAEGVRDLL